MRPGNSYSTGSINLFCYTLSYKTDKSLKLRLKNIRFERKLLLPCILLGTSPALMQLTENMVAISFNTSLQKYGGDIAVASMSILTSIMQFVMLLLPRSGTGSTAIAEL